MTRTLAVALLVVLCTPVARADAPYVWKNVAVHGGGFITGIVTHPKEAGLIYCRTDIGGAYRWDARKKLWFPLNDWVSLKEGNLLGIESIAIDPNDPNKLYLAAGTYTNNSKDVTSILRSSDRGGTFQRCDLPIPMGANDGGRPVGSASPSIPSMATSFSSARATKASGPAPTPPHRGAKSSPSPPSRLTSPLTWSSAAGDPPAGGPGPSESPSSSSTRETTLSTSVSARERRAFTDPPMPAHRGTKSPTSPSACDPITPRCHARAIFTSVSPTSPARMK